MDNELLMDLIKLLLQNEKKNTVTETPNKKYLIGEYVVVRCRDAGVHAGVLVDYHGREVIIKESRRLWYYKCKSGHSLSGVVLNGITSESKIAGLIKGEIVLSEACEILPTTEDSERSITDAKEYNT